MGKGTVAKLNDWQCLDSSSVLAVCGVEQIKFPSTNSTGQQVDKQKGTRETRADRGTARKAATKSLIDEIFAGTSTCGMKRTADGLIYQTGMTGGKRSMQRRKKRAKVCHLGGYRPEFSKDDDL